VSNLRALRILEDEPYVDRKTLAELMGVSLRTIDYWTAEGMPSVTWGLRTRRYRPSLAMQWARSREQAA